MFQSRGSLSELEGVAIDQLLLKQEERCLQVCRYLLLKGHKVTINTGAPHGFFQQQLPADGLTLRKVLLDCGAFQLDAFTVDMKSEWSKYSADFECDPRTAEVSGTPPYSPETAQGRWRSTTLLQRLTVTPSWLLKSPGSRSSGWT